MKLNRTSKLGILVFSTLIIFIWGLNFLKGRDLLSREPIFYARYHNVQGLTPSAIVELNGFKIGYVRDITFADDFSGDLIVKIALFKELNLPKTTTAKIVSLDFLGTKGVRLEPGKDMDHYHVDRDTLISATQPDLLKEINDQLLPIKQKAEVILGHADSTIMAINNVLNPATTKDLQGAISSLQSMLQSLDHNSQTVERVLAINEAKLNATFGNFHSLSDTLLMASKSFKAIGENTAALTNSLNEAELEQTIAQLHELLTTMNSSEGSIGKLINDETAHDALVAAAQNLDKLLQDLRQNPKKYINVSAVNFGGSDVIMVPDDLGEDEDISFNVFLQEGQEPNAQELASLQPFKSLEYKGETLYYSRSTHSFKEARNMLDTASKHCLSPEMKAYKNERSISIERAIKKLQY